MKRNKVLKFDEVMNLYEEIFRSKRPVRVDSRLKAVTPKTVAGRIRETIRLSEEIIWKRRSKR